MKEPLYSFPYFSYLLRFWPECPPDETPQWRFALVDPKTGKQLGFATLEALMDYLSGLTQSLQETNYQMDAQVSHPFQDETIR